MSLLLIRIHCLTLRKRARLYLAEMRYMTKRYPLKSTRHHVHLLRTVNK